jgi:predicted  nucleic acid-binding Zn-ribbon protein
MAREKKEAEMSVEARLKALYQLQTLLSEIDKIKTLRGELPLEVQDLEDEIEGLKTRIEKAQSDIEALDNAIKEKENAIGENEAMIARYKSQLDNVRNNREYDTLNKEIEFTGLEIELCEKKIREAGQSIAQKQDEISRSSALLVEREKDLDVKRTELEEIVAETKAEEESLREKAKNLEASFDDSRLLTAFKRIRKNSRNGLGIVYVERDACGGCFNKIPPQRQLDIRMRKKIIVCEYCGRIMIDPELAGVKLDTASASEEKPKKRSIRRRKTEE